MITAKQALKAKYWLQAAADSAIVSQYVAEKSFHLAECENELRKAAEALGFELRPIQQAQDEGMKS